MEEEITHPVGKPGEVVAISGRRLGVQASEWLSDWYISHSPRNDNSNAEGHWCEWVGLANTILKVEQERLRQFAGDIEYASWLTPNV